MLGQVFPSFLRRSPLMIPLLTVSGANSLFCDAWNTLPSQCCDVNTRGELLDVDTVSFSVFLCSSSVIVVLIHFLMFFVPPSVCNLSSGEKGIDVGCGVWTEISSSISQPWMISAFYEFWMCCWMTLKSYQLRHIDGYHGVIELCWSRIWGVLRLLSFSALPLIFGPSS